MFSEKDWSLSLRLKQAGFCAQWHSFFHLKILPNIRGNKKAFFSSSVWCPWDAAPVLWLPLSMRQKLGGGLEDTGRTPQVFVVGVCCSIDTLVWPCPFSSEKLSVE